VQRLIDSGAYICYKEQNGMEMVAEYTREVGAETEATFVTNVKKACLSVLLRLSNVSYDSGANFLK